MNKAIMDIPDDGAGKIEKLEFDFTVDDIDSDKGRGYANGTLKIAGKPHTGYFEYSYDAGPSWHFPKEAQDILNAIREGEFAEWDDFIGEICTEIADQSGLKED